MRRRDFTKLSGAFLASPAVLRAQVPAKVVVVGAGSAGLTAAYHLTRAGVDVQVLEAANRWGGRVKRDTGLADVPLDLGAEWIHTEPTVFGEMLGQGASTLGVETIDYAPQTFQFWNGRKIGDFNALRHVYAEWKFFDTTWYGFFERFVVPSIASKITLNAPVGRVAQDAVILTTGQRVEADAVIITTPISALQSGALQVDGFELQRGALSEVTFGRGFKVFLTFTDRFYPDILTTGSRWDALSSGWSQKIYYDAAFGKATQDNILGLFTVNEGPLPRAALSPDALVEDVMSELTEIFGSTPRNSFQRARVQNWSHEPFIAGSYSMENASDTAIEDILAPIGTIHFAGEALGGGNQSTVHGAAFSAINAVERLLP